MTEADLMRKEGQLFTEKQYRKCFSLIVISLVVSGLITLTGAIIAIATTVANIVIVGIVIGAIGFTMLMICLVFVFRYSAKIQLYRHYKKHPEDFEKEIEQKN
ncbi:MAG: hypothetical protein ACOYJS_06715 [Acutalibacteraceae bacterium]